ncbi:asparaginase [Actinoplanes philippinensis]|uniref:asparaginase n=1 Tax=Actinoplanes philippinensis TaxID=35752 RepID=UPI0033CA61D4
MSSSPRVLVAGLGGTIAMTGDAVGGVTPTLSARDLVGAVPGLDGSADLEVVTFRNQPGAALTIGDLVELSGLLARGFADGVVGAVITQGTDTIEETAYVLGLLHPGDEPIAVTGAMRNPTLAGADGPANLLAAVRVAASPEARGLGCVVVLADEIHAAGRVRKTHTSSVAAFTSPVGGPLGYLSEGRPHVLNRPHRPRALPIPPVGPSPRVGLYTATLGDDGGLLPVLAASLDGLVIAGFGVGHVPASWVPHLAAIARRIPVVLTSRTGAGFTATSTYGYPGAERDLLARGLISGGALDPYKCRLLLQLLLATATSAGEVREAFTGITRAVDRK